MQARSYRVLMVAPTSFFADYGCHVRILEEARILQKLGQQVTIATYHNGNPVSGLDIRRTLPVPWRSNYLVGSSRHKIALDALLGIKTLQLLARGKYDLIHAHLHEGALIGQVLGKLFRLPVVFDFQGSMTEEMIDHHFLARTSKLYPPLLNLEKWLDHRCQVVLTSSEHSERLLLERFGCERQRVQPLPDCANTNIFKPASEYAPAELAALRAELGIPAGRRLIVYLGLLAEYQGVGLLLEAVARLIAQQRDAHLLLMGFPNEMQYLQRARAMGIGSHVTLTGRLPYQQAPIHLALGDVAAAPKLSATEGAGKILNYMAVGLPVVAFDTPVAREYLGYDGLYALRGDSASLAEHLEHCLYPTEDDASRYRQIGERLRQRVIQQYSWDLAGERLLATYAEVCAQAPKARAARPKWVTTRQ